MQQGSAVADRVLVLMPTAGDAERTAVLLGESGVSTMTCSDIGMLCREMRAGASAVLLTDEYLSADSSGELAEAVRDQPPWSSVPLVVLAREGTTQRLDNRVLDSLTSMIVVERPVHTRTLLSVVLSALRSRGNQYQIRDALLLREQQAEEMRAQEERLRSALIELQKSQAALARQAEQLREAGQRKDEFLATLAHELRNPLAPIQTGLDLLARSRDPDKLDHALEVMHRQLRHMVRLIDDLLDVSRITQGKLELKRSQITLEEVVDTAVEASRPAIERRKHTLNVSIQDAGLIFDADLTRLAQVLSNLLNNAAKYTPAGGNIEISAYRDDDFGVIEVRDDGIGIPPEQLERVFEMFSQVNRATEGSRGGLGIGLALVRSLVELHGGTVTAQSTGQGGSTFQVKLRLAPEQCLGPAPRPSAFPDRPDKKRVLVVDDNDDAADMLSLMLEQAQYTTNKALDGPSALAAIASWTPDVVILDIGLPGMSGYDVARELSRTGLRDRLELIALTGWGSHEDRQRALDAGFDVHLTKPVDAEKLYGALAMLEARAPVNSH
jgi:signal transduction histidine kinase/ActR/RegA family two-component response regulator